MSRNLLAVLVVFGSVVCAADLPAKWASRIETADGTYQQAVQTADNTRFYAVQKANATRVKAFRQVLTDATKAGDFDAATTIKERVADAEKDGSPKERPKGVVKFGGHEYAYVIEAVTWHIAKRRCEEMGGHLAIINTPNEQGFIFNLCRTTGNGAWVGATDEEAEGKWKWIDGSDARFNSPHVSVNGNELEHYMIFDLTLNDWNDVGAGRAPFICEWHE